jgi:hypothetical protein
MRIAPCLSERDDFAKSAYADGWRAGWKKDIPKLNPKKTRHFSDRRVGKPAR